MFRYASHDIGLAFGHASQNLRLTIVNNITERWQELATAPAGQRLNNTTDRAAIQSTTGGGLGEPSAPAFGNVRCWDAISLRRATPGSIFSGFFKCFLCSLARRASAEPAKCAAAGSLGGFLSNFLTKHLATKRASDARRKASSGNAAGQSTNASSATRGEPGHPVTKCVSGFRLVHAHLLTIFTIERR